MVLLFSACNSTKEIRTAKKNISGEWSVQTVTVAGTTTNDNIKVFDEAGFKCFIGSTWHFTKKNDMGYYSLQTGKDCAAVQKNIHWSFEKKETGTQLSFTTLDANMQFIDPNKIYFLDVAMLNATNMQLKWNISYDNKAVAIVFNFIKNK